jgi:hypothetical protein
MCKKILIVIDKPCKKLLYNNQKVKVIDFIQEKYETTDHAEHVALSFTKFNKHINLCFSDLTEKNLIEIFMYFLPFSDKCNIFLPFGSPKNLAQLDSIICKYPANTIFVSAPNTTYKPQMYPAISKNTTVISNTRNNNAVNIYLDLYKKEKIIIKSKTKITNSLSLGLYSFLKTKKLINNNGETNMPLWNFDNNYVFEVSKQQLFAFQISDENVVFEEACDTVFLDDGFIYGSLEETTSFRINYNGEVRTYYFKVVEPVFDESVQQFMPAKNGNQSGGLYFEDGTSIEDQGQPEYTSGTPYYPPLYVGGQGAGILT